MIATAQHPQTIERTLEVECARVGTQLVQARPALAELLRRRQNGAVLFWGTSYYPMVAYRDDLTLEQRAAHVRFLLAKLAAPGASGLLHDRSLMIYSPEFA